MNKESIIKIFKESHQENTPTGSWKKKARVDILFFAQTHIPVIYHNNTNYKQLFISFSFFVLILLILVPTTDALAANSKPGEILYPVGRFFERAKVNMASGEQKKQLIEEHLEKRVADLEYTSQLDNDEYENKIIEDLADQTEEIIENDQFNLEEKREIAGRLKERLTAIEESKRRETLSEHLEGVKIILSKTEIRIEYKENEENNNPEEEVLGIGGIEMPVEENKFNENNNQETVQTESKTEAREEKTAVNTPTPTPTQQSKITRESKDSDHRDTSKEN